MGCCKCEEHKWTDPQEVVWEDPADGKGYCVFHAPKEKYKKLGSNECYSNDEFNNLFFSCIYSKESNSIYDAKESTLVVSGIVFPGDITIVLGLEWKISQLIFNDSIFYGNVALMRILCSDSAIFLNTTFYGNVRIMRVKFMHDVSFQNVSFKKSVVFGWVEFIYKATFQYCDFLSLSLHMQVITQQSLGNIVFKSSAVPAFDLIDCRWPLRLGLDTYDEKGSSATEELYRAMKRRAAEEHDQPLVSRWHFREKFMQLKQIFKKSCEMDFKKIASERGGVLWGGMAACVTFGETHLHLKKPVYQRSNDLLEAVEDADSPWLKRVKAWLLLLWHRPHWPKLTFTGLYWATSGFGERYIRAGVWLAILVAISFLANAIPEPIDWTRLWLSAAANATLASIPFAKDIPGDGWVRVARGVWQLLIAVQFTLFALAVRNHFRR